MAAHKIKFKETAVEKYHISYVIYIGLLFLTNYGKQNFRVGFSLSKCSPELNKQLFEKLFGWEKRVSETVPNRCTSYCNEQD